ncbi:unnamed protein product [Rhizophagus irregularis]|nr:unnamed protein product [Rhizophagus irregularis]
MNEESEEEVCLNLKLMKNQKKKILCEILQEELESARKVTEVSEDHGKDHGGTIPWTLMSHDWKMPVPKTILLLAKLRAYFPLRQQILL